jgi:hypothetical protein
MSTQSTFSKLDIPYIDLWAFLFERNDKPFPDHKGMLSLVQAAIRQKVMEIA